MREFALAMSVLLAQALSVGARAQTSDVNDAVVGDADDAMPGYVETRVADERPAGFALSARLGYGITESLRDAPGPHNRTTMSLAIAAQPLTWLSIGLRFDGRADFHPDDMMGRDRGAVLTGGLSLRAAKVLGNGLGLGTQLTLFTAGGTDAFGFDGISLEATGLVSYRSGGLSLAAELGYRLDRSARSIDAGAMYRPGDQLALGVSDFDAVLVRLGVGYRRDAIEVMGEARWDALLGGGAPSFSNQPLHVAFGGRIHPSHTWQLEAVIDLCASSRPAVGNGATIPFVVIDPRIAFRFGASFRFGGGEPGADAEVEPETEPEITENTEVTEPEVVEVDGPRTLRGAVRDASGAAIVDAHVVVRIGDRVADGYTGGEGEFVIEGIAEGNAQLEVTATHYRSVSRSLGAGTLTIPNGVIVMEQAAASGVIRGLVRDFEGHPVRATVRLRPGSSTTQTSEDGTFQIEVAPGRYTVVVDAPGFVAQNRQVELVDGQVTIYNVDLRRE